jgi:hypothetical protein
MYCLPVGALFQVGRLLRCSLRGYFRSWLWGLSHAVSHTWNFSLGILCSSPLSILEGYPSEVFSSLRGADDEYPLWPSKASMQVPCWLHYSVPLWVKPSWVIQVHLYPVFFLKSRLQMLTHFLPPHISEEFLVFVFLLVTSCFFASALI